MATTTQRKTCFIVTRYFVKRTGSVCCIVRNEQGIDYTTCVHANGRTSCTCPGGEKGMKCYHVKHVLAKEAARPASKRVASNRVTSVQVARVSAQPIKASNALPKAPVVSPDLIAMGAISSSNKAFCIMRR